MTRLHDLSIGKDGEFKRLLAQAGLTVEDVQAVLENPRLALTMVEALRGQLAPSWYVASEQQLENVRRWNQERDWGFTEADIPEVPEGLAPRGPLEIPVLSVYLPDKVGVSGYVRTARELWGIARHRQPNSWQWPELRLDADHIRLLEGIEPFHEPGIRWVMLDLGAHWNGQDGVRPHDVRDKDSAHAEVLAAAGHFPGWPRAMDGKNVPYVWIAGYQVMLPSEDAWTRVPFLYWSSVNSWVGLSARWDARRFWLYAAPVLKQL